MALSKHILKRGKSDTLHLRVPVPRSVQPLFKNANGKPRTQVWRSLGTSDPRIAERRARQEFEALQRHWDELEAGQGNDTPRDPAAVAVSVGYDAMLSAMEERRKAWPRTDAEYEERLAQREADLRRYTRRLQDGDTADWEAVADRAIAQRGLAIAKDSNTYAAFVQAIAEASIDAMGVFTRRAAGELDAMPRTAVVRDAKAKEAQEAQPGETLLELFDAWGAEMLSKGEKRADTVNQDRKVIEQFAAFVGKKRAIDSITPVEIADYRDTLRNLPPKWMSKRELRGLDMRAAALKARELECEQTAYTTVNKHLSTISPLYKWIAAKPKWAGLRNPCSGLFHAKVKGKNRRPSFHTDTLNRMLSSPLFTGFLSDGQEHVPGNLHADDWRRWIPLGAMFTGARIGEIAQLRIGDVRKERGVWFVRIRHAAKQGLSTKSGESRPAAVHPMLERIGFVAFRERQLQKANGDLTAPLFPELEPNQRGQISGTPSRWWRGYLQAIGVKDGADGQGAHSFRHTLSDRLRSEAELLDNQIAVCLGHSVKSTTGGYGELSQGTVNMLSGWMNAVRFDGVNFDHLLPAD